VAQGLASKGNMIPGAIATAAFPTLTSGVVNRARSDWMGQYNKLHDFTCFLLVPVTAAVAMLGVVVMALVFNQEAVKKGLAAKKTEADFNEILALDEKRRELLLALDGKRKEVNAANDEISKLIKDSFIIKKKIRMHCRQRARIREEEKRQGRHTGTGKRRGCDGARMPVKVLWMRRQRTLRRLLKKYREAKKMDVQWTEDVGQLDCSRSTVSHCTTFRSSDFASCAAKNRLTFCDNN